MRIIDTNGIVVTQAFTPVNLTVKEIDTSPSITNCNEIRIANGSLTNLGFGKVQIATVVAADNSPAQRLRLAGSFR